jgi:hypothetical protein
LQNNNNSGGSGGGGLAAPTHEGEYFPPPSYHQSVNNGMFRYEFCVSIASDPYPVLQASLHLVLLKEQFSRRSSLNIFLLLSSQHQLLSQ